MFEDIFCGKRVIPEKLRDYGFKKCRNNFVYTAKILSGEFLLEITFKNDEFFDTKLTETATSDEYILYKTEAVGSFVGDIRKAISEILCDIAEKCCENAAFCSKQSAQVIDYIRKKYGDELEFLWEKSSGNAVWRRKDTNKWYGVMLTISRRKLGFDSDKTAEIINLKGRTEDIERLVDNKRYFPGWHMKKKHWFTVVLDGTVILSEICKRIDESYLLVK